MKALFSPFAHTTAATPEKSERGRQPWRSLDERRLARSQAFRAVGRNGNSGTPGVFGVRPDRIDHGVEFGGAVDLVCALQPWPIDRIVRTNRASANDDFCTSF